MVEQKSRRTRVVGKRTDKVHPKHFCLGTEVRKHSAESVGTYDHTAVCRTKGCMLIVFITNDPFRMLEC